MLGSVVQHVTALTERHQVPRSVVAGIMVEVSVGQHYFGCSDGFDSR